MALWFFCLCGCCLACKTWSFATTWPEYSGIKKRKRGGGGINNTTNNNKVWFQLQYCQWQHMITIELIRYKVASRSRERIGKYWVSGRERENTWGEMHRMRISVSSSLWDNCCCSSSRSMWRISDQRLAEQMNEYWSGKEQIAFERRNPKELPSSSCLFFYFFYLNSFLVVRCGEVSSIATYLILETESTSRYQNMEEKKNRQKERRKPYLLPPPKQVRKQERERKKKAHTKMGMD